MSNGCEGCVVFISVLGHSVRALTKVICLLIIPSECQIVNYDKTECKALRVDTGLGSVM